MHASRPAMLAGLRVAVGAGRGCGWSANSISFVFMSASRVKVQFLLSAATYNTSLGTQMFRQLINSLTVLYRQADGAGFARTRWRSSNRSRTGKERRDECETNRSRAVVGSGSVRVQAAAAAR